MSNNIISREEYQVKKLMEGLGKNKTSQAEAEKEKKPANKEVNEYMPKYIVQAPWYLNQKEEESLAHQRSQGGKSKISINEWYQRGVQPTAAYKYRKGACENCGAMTHKVKECLERPRKVGAKWTGQDIKPDEYIQNLQLDYDSKRDRWSGYDPEMYSEVIKEHEHFEEIRKQMRHSELDKNGAGSEGEEAHIDDEYKERIFESNEPVNNKQDPKIKTNTRNLRIREDTAKYLLNLNEDSAYYDGKSHSMRENPNATSGDQTFKGDNFARLTGDAAKLLEQEKFTWELIQKEGADFNSIANPTATEMIYRKAKEKMTEQAKEKNRKLVEKYGESQEQAPDLTVLLGQSETYVEYTPDGKIKTTRAKAQAGKSRYEEDVYPNDHTSVWGSWWNEELGWGFACCHQNEKGSMCLGERGKKMALVKEFKIKKAKQEQLSTFAKEVIGEEVVMDQEVQKQEAPKNTENSSEEQKPIQAPAPLPEIFEKPAQEIPVSKEVKAPEAILVPKQKEETVHKLIPGRNSDQKKKNVKNESDSSATSSDSSSSDSSDSSDNSGSDSDSDSASSRSSSSSRSGRKKKASKLKEKEDRRRREKNHRHRRDDDDERLKRDIKKQEKKVKNAHDDRKRKYNSVKGDNNDVSLEEIEAYKLVKRRFDDPMYHA